ncbi:transposase [Erwinia tasmaniensis]|uniref:transposase n=1 Tax=Erwinia tasmaniensis TaxID=338565 RepID=UPI00031C3AD4
MSGKLPGLDEIRDECRCRRCLQTRYWKVHFAKKTLGSGHNVKYLSLYLKRPVRASRLHHYSGGGVIITILITPRGNINEKP